MNTSWGRLRCWRQFCSPLAVATPLSGPPTDLSGSCDQWDVADTETCEYNQNVHPADSQKPELSEWLLSQNIKSRGCYLNSNIEYRKPDNEVDWEVDWNHPYIYVQNLPSARPCARYWTTRQKFFFHLFWKTKLPAIPPEGYNCYIRRRLEHRPELGNIVQVKVGKTRRSGVGWGSRQSE